MCCQYVMLPIRSKKCLDAYTFYICHPEKRKKHYVVYCALTIVIYVKTTIYVVFSLPYILREVQFVWSLSNPSSIF